MFAKPRTIIIFLVAALLITALTGLNSVVFYINHPAPTQPNVISCNSETQGGQSVSGGFPFSWILSHTLLCNGQTYRGISIGPYGSPFGLIPDFVFWLIVIGILAVIQRYSISTDKGLAGSKNLSYNKKLMTASLMAVIFILIISASNVFAYTLQNSFYWGGASCGLLSRQPILLTQVPGGYPLPWLIDHPYDYGCTLTSNSYSIDPLGLVLDIIIWFAVAWAIMTVLKRQMKMK
jgi:hypothetical protein